MWLGSVGSMLKRLFFRRRWQKWCVACVSRSTMTARVDVKDAKQWSERATFARTCSTTPGREHVLIQRSRRVPKARDVMGRRWDPGKTVWNGWKASRRAHQGGPTGLDVTAAKPQLPPVPRRRIPSTFWPPSSQRHSTIPARRRPTTIRHHVSSQLPGTFRARHSIGGGAPARPRKHPP
ncbi:uncharacterized protein IWZ02DRAFT_284593 [Phyllosticta citriasiana]|uniref:uncharacterized protein n=1 Tax=Phyllosticta citriasiana TaxID=595635 RepID=UPI0030FD3E33